MQANAIVFIDDEAQDGLEYEEDDSDDSSQRSSAVYLARPQSTDRLATALQSALCHDREISTKRHLRAATHLLQLQEMLLNGSDLSKSGQIGLMCSLSSLLRRVVRLEAAAAAEEDDYVKKTDILDTRSEFVRTSALVFVCMASADLLARKGVPAFDEPAALARLQEARSLCAWEALCSAKKRKRRALEDEADANAEDATVFERSRLEELVGRPFEDQPQDDWFRALHEPAALAAASMGAAVHAIARADDVTELALNFARYSRSQMSIQLLNKDSDANFLSLSTSALVAASNDGHDAVVASIVSAAESEAGQTILRELVLSFLLPARVVGVRRTLALSRETSERTTSEFPLIADAAHRAAMQGANYLWENSNSQLLRMCALLSGVAILTTRSHKDVVRKATAFDGRVELPFLETTPPPPSQKRMALVSTTRSFSVYTLSRGQPVVELSCAGLQGLILAVLAMKHDF